MTKPGHDLLKTVPNFPSVMYDQLKDLVKITTVEELISNSTRYPRVFHILFNMSPDEWNEVMASVLDVLTDAEVARLCTLVPDTKEKSTL